MGCNQRVGLLVLGTLKLVLIDLLGLGLYASLIIMNRGMPLISFIIECLAAVFILFDVINSIVLLCGSQKSSRTMLRVYFWYSITSFIISVLQTSYAMCSFALNRPPYSMTIDSTYGVWNMITHSFEYFLTIIYFGFFNLVLQVFIMIIVRQQIRKLKTTKSADDAELQPM